MITPRCSENYRLLLRWKETPNRDNFINYSEHYRVCEQCQKHLQDIFDQSRPMPVEEFEEECEELPPF